MKGQYTIRMIRRLKTKMIAGIDDAIEVIEIADSSETEKLKAASEVVNMADRLKVAVESEIELMESWKAESKREGESE